MSDITLTVLALSFRRLIAIHDALKTLGNRKLPSITSDFKVARRLDAVKPAVERFETLRKKTIAEHTETDDQGEGKLVRAIALQQTLDALLDTVDEIPAPKSKLTEADLPKPMKGDDGEKNAAGLGAIIADLGPEFFETPEE
jgi:hypothetical protein